MAQDPQPGLPFGFGQFDLSQVMRLLQSEGPINLEVARQVAVWVAGQEVSEGPPPIEPVNDALYAELTRTAQIHVQGATGLGAELEPRPGVVGRDAWAASTLEALEPVLTKLAERLAQGTRPAQPEAGTAPDLASLMGAMAPVLFGVQAGFMIGHLSSRVLGHYEMPLPLAGPPMVCFVAPNVDAFERGWELPAEELRFYVAFHEVLHAAMRAVPWVQRRLLALADEYVGNFDVNPGALEERLGAVDPNDPSSLEAALGDPAEFLATIRPPAQQRVLERLQALVALLEGYADHVLEQVARPLLPAFDRIREASHRHRVERGEAARFLEALLGFEVGREDYERAAAFCAGVVERAGEDGLARLFEAERMLPTLPELEAPGLWLERIDLPDDLDDVDRPDGN